MTWTTSKDLKGQLFRLWERGELLRDTVTGNMRFPLRLTLKGPSSADVTERFNAVRAWVAEISTAPHLHLEWQEIRHRVQGTQSLPASAWVNTIEDALIWIGKQREWDHFAALGSATRDSKPTLLPWLEKRPLQALALAEDWPQLLSVVGWFMDHPRPGIYLRQVDLPGVHSKFIESHRSVLAELLDLTLHTDAIDSSKTSANQFAVRYGFLEKPTRIRFRVLDPDIQILSGLVCPDITLDSESFSRLNIDVKRVFITENEINFLAFPSVKGSIVVFGAGYGWEALSRTRWLNGCQLYYWGDIDTHGFAILDQLRGRFPHVESFLMDRATLDAHTLVWGVEDKPSRIELSNLTVNELALYNDLRDNRIRSGLRLEQEHISFGWLSHRLQELLGEA